MGGKWRAARKPFSDGTGVSVKVSDGSRCCSRTGEGASALLPAHTTTARPATGTRLSAALIGGNVGVGRFCPDKFMRVQNPTEGGRSKVTAPRLLLPAGTPAPACCSSNGSSADTRVVSGGRDPSKSTNVGAVAVVRGPSVPVRLGWGPPRSPCELQCLH